MNCKKIVNEIKRPHVQKLHIWVIMNLKEIFKSKELVEESVIRKIRITANDGKNYNINFYSLDAIIAVGYNL